MKWSRFEFDRMGSGEVVIDVDKGPCSLTGNRCELCANTLGQVQLVRMRLNLAPEFISTRELWRFSDTIGGISWPKQSRQRRPTCPIRLCIAGYLTYTRRRPIYQPRRNLPQLQLFLPLHQFPLNPTYKKLAMRAITTKHQLSSNQPLLNFSREYYFPTSAPSQ